MCLYRRRRAGAGSGMGREGVKLFHANGWRVGAVDRNSDGLTSLTAQLGDERLWTRTIDVTDKAALDAALADFCAGNAGGGLDPTNSPKTQPTSSTPAEPSTGASRSAIGLSRQ